MIKQVHILIIIFLTLIISSCSTAEADKVFGDANFKKSITLIELYYIRNGEYPDSLKQIPFTSGFEDMAFSGVRYQKLDSGYHLDLIRGHMGFPEDLSYPSDFWNGLGCLETNLKK